MKIFDFLRREKRQRDKKVSDFYQESLDKFGRDQIKKLVDKGLSVPVVML